MRNITITYAGRDSLIKDLDRNEPMPINLAFDYQIPRSANPFGLDLTLREDELDNFYWREIEISVESDG